MHTLTLVFKIERYFVQGGFPIFGPTKNWGVPRCVTYSRGRPKMCDKV